MGENLEDFTRTIDVCEAFYKNKTISSMFKKIILEDMVSEGESYEKSVDIAEGFETFWDPVGVGDSDVWWDSSAEELVGNLEEVLIKFKLSEAGNLITGIMKAGIKIMTGGETEIPLIG